LAAPEKCLPVLKKSFGAKRVEVQTFLRGQGI
jgi:hypothetical protein